MSRKKIYGRLVFLFIGIENKSCVKDFFLVRRKSFSPVHKVEKGSEYYYRLLKEANPASFKDPSNDPKFHLAPTTQQSETEEKRKHEEEEEQEININDFMNHS